MKKIAYIELDTHAEIAANFRELMEGSLDFSVDYYFSKKILNLLSLKKEGNITQVSEKDLLEKLKEKTYDLVIIGTAHRYFHVFLEVTRLFPTAIIGHNLHFIESSIPTILRNVFKKEINFRVKLLVKEGLIYKNKVYQNAKAIFVLDEKLASEEFVYFPLFFNQYWGYEERERFKIVIPGIVSQKRRNYFSVIQELSQLKTEQNLEVVFLGKAEGEELNRLRVLEQKLAKKTKIKIAYFTEKLPQNFFDEQMKKADVLYCPIQIETEFFSVREVYGQTKMSGNIGDAIKFGKKAIFPKTYDVERFFVDNKSLSLVDILEKNQKTREEDWRKFRKEQILVDLEKIMINFVENLEK